MRKNIQYLTIQIFSRLDLTSKENLELRDMNISLQEYEKRYQKIKSKSKNSKRLLNFISEYDNGFFKPERCDVYEPIREIFDPNDLNEPIKWLSRPWGRVMVKRMKLFRYEGFVENLRFDNHWIDNNKTPEPRGPDPIFITEWCLWMRIKLIKLKTINEVKKFFVDLYLVSEGDYGFITMEEDHKNKNFQVLEMAGGKNTKFVGMNLEQCLPGVYWGNIFGKLYVDWFGIKKFDSLPCYKKEKLKDGSYYIQASDDLYYYEKPGAINFEKDIKRHLGLKAFFDIRKPARRCDVPEYIKRNRRSDDPTSF